MKKPVISLALALGLAALAMPATAQNAQRPPVQHGTMDHGTMDRGTMNHGTGPGGTMNHDNMDRGPMRDAARAHDQHDMGRNDTMRHRGWSHGGKHRKCWTTWRHHHRVKTCGWR